MTKVCEGLTGVKSGPRFARRAEGARRKKRRRATPSIFPPTLEFPAFVTFRLSPRRGERLLFKPPAQDCVFTEHAEGLSGEKGECFAGKAELE